MSHIRDIVCEECGKFVIRTDKSNGAAGSEVNMRKLGIYKMPILYGITDGGHFFCCKDCFKLWLDARTTPEQREKGRKSREELKQKMEASKPELLRRLQRIQAAYNKLNKQ